MNWITKMNAALDYIEDNLVGELTPESIASIACTSKFHFLKTFSILSGKSLGEYIRERKITHSAKDVVNSNKKIVDIALSYGYETPEAFTKAFKRFHGLSPKEARNKNKILTVAPPLRFNIDVRGAERMQYKISQMKSFKVTGPSIKVKTTDSSVVIPRFIKRKWRDGTIPRLYEAAGPLTVMGVLYNYSPDHEYYRYMISIEQSEKSLDLYNETVEIPDASWAIFSGKGKYPESVKECWTRIYAEWFPATGYKHDDAPQLVFIRNKNRKEVAGWEIWIPVLKEEK